MLILGDDNYIVQHNGDDTPPCPNSSPPSYSSIENGDCISLISLHAYQFEPSPPPSYIQATKSLPSGDMIGPSPTASVPTYRRSVSIHGTSYI